MPRDNLGAAFSIDITDLKAGLAEANRLIRASESEFQEAAAGMDDWSDSAEGLQKRVDSLTDQVDIQKEKVSALVKEKQSIIDKMTAEGKSNEEISKAVDGVNKSITRESKTLSSLQGNLEKSKKNLDKFKKAQKDSRGATDKLKDTISDQEDELQDLKKAYSDAVLSQGKNSKEAKRLKGEYKKLSDQIGKNKKKLDEAEKSLDDTGDAAEDAGKKMSGLKTACKIGAAAIAAVGAAAAGLVVSFLGLAESTQETRTNMNKLETSFKDVGFSATDAQGVFKDLYGILGDEDTAVEAAGNIAELADNEEDLSAWTRIATGVYAKFKDGIPIEGLAEAANETAKVGKVTGSLADALNWTTMSQEGWERALGGNKKALKAFNRAVRHGESAEDAFNAALSKCSTEQERQELITATLNELYGETADAYRETNKEVIAANEATLNYNQAMADLGDKARPITTAIRNGFAGVIEKVNALLEDVDWDAITNAINNAFAYFIDTIIPAIINGIQWIIDNKDILVAGIAAVGTAFLAWNVVTMIQGVVSAIKGMTVAQAALNLVMSMNPIGIVVAALAGLTAAFIALWNNCEGFREFWIGLWETIKSVCITAWEAISTFFTETVPQIISNVGEWFSQLPGAIKQWLDVAIGNVKEWGTNVWDSVSSTCSNVFNSVVTWFSQLPGKIWEFLTGAASNVVTWGGDLASKGLEAAQKFLNSVVNSIKQLPGKIWQWLSTAAGKVVSWGGDLASKGLEAAKQLLNSIVDKVKEIPGELISSGKDIVAGLWEGISSKVDWLKEKVKGWCGGVVDTIKGWFGIASPSKLMRDEIGKNLALGVGVGFEKNLKGVSGDMARALNNAVPSVGVNASSPPGALASGSSGGVVINQTNNYANAHSRYEIYKSKQETAAAVRLALGGAY